MDIPYTLKAGRLENSLNTYRSIKEFLANEESFPSGQGIDLGFEYRQYLKKVAYDDTNGTAKPKCTDLAIICANTKGVDYNKLPRRELYKLKQQSQKLQYNKQGPIDELKADP